MDTNTKGQALGTMLDEDLQARFHEEFGDMSGEEVLVALHNAVRD